MDLLLACHQSGHCLCHRHRVQEDKMLHVKGGRSVSRGNISRRSLGSMWSFQHAGCMMRGPDWSQYTATCVLQKGREGV